MAPVVIDRSPRCYDGFMEDFIIKRAER